MTKNFKNLRKYPEVSRALISHYNHKIAVVWWVIQELKVLRI